MGNFIAYFYNIMADKIEFNNQYYFFYYKDYLYHLYPIDERINVNMIINITNQLHTYAPISEIIINKDKEYISYYNNMGYILIKVYIDETKKISLTNIFNLSNMQYFNENKNNWGLLWSNKIDYLEDIISENGKKYPLLVDSFNYFVGLTENAISYYNDIILDNQLLVVSHKVLREDSLVTLYNPLNIIFDYRARDIAEYMKLSFFNGSDIFSEMDKYINFLSRTDVLLIIARLLYPSFYFQTYDDILIYNKDEKILLPIINNIQKYELFLADAINYFQKYYDIPGISWLQKKEDLTLH